MEMGKPWLNEVRACPIFLSSSQDFVGGVSMGNWYGDKGMVPDTVRLNLRKSLLRLFGSLVAIGYFCREKSKEER